MTSRDDANKQVEDLKQEEKPKEESAAEDKAENGTAQDAEKDTVAAEGNPEDTEGCKEEEKEAADGCGENADAEKADSAAAAEEEALNTKYLRLMADFQNYKRRTEKEKNDIYAFANEKIVSELLNVIDNFERALAHGVEGDSFTEGMNMIFKQLKAVLEKAGVTEIEALGEDFDPNFHNAVMTEDSDRYESGKVIEVLQKGYILNNRVIRPSMVKVSN